ncbi:MAG: hypothetical protein HYZ95_04050 [Candidatus Omnitrophica bacterium]|nr:hypothetical protein [Candidatus Omnitrophota bacterium]
MKEFSDQELDRLLKEAYAPVEVSSDFTLQLWRRLIQQPATDLWRKAAPALALAALVGIGLGLRTLGPIGPAEAATLRQPVRWDLYGSAPHDTLAGGALRITQEEPR